ncbi:MAG TPA: YIP1 family protein [Terriglobales bacterium]|nr:YIP1 family protein [Terriglobales bacterium]
MSTSAPNPMPVSTSETEPVLSEGERLVNVFIAPSKTFSDLRRKANWFVPWLVLAIASWSFIGVVSQKIGFKQVSENQMRMNPKAQERLAQLPADRRERGMEISTMITKTFAFAFPVLALLIYLVIAAVLMGTFNFALGTEVPFHTSLAIVIYAQLPRIIRLVLAIISLFAGADPESFILSNPVASNPGFLVDASAHPALYVLASSFDIFTLWTIVLIGIGFACVSKVKRSTAIVTVFGWYVLITLVTVGFTAAFS